MYVIGCKSPGGSPPLHATYLTDRHAFALWRSPELPPLPGADTTVPLAVAHPAIAVTEVACRIVAAADLPDGDSGSLAGWRALVADPAADVRLPPAAHATPDPLGRAITSGGYARETFAATARVGDELRDVLHADLRDYQVRGVSWLAESIRRCGGAVLADEMGLGKTLQAIGYLVHAQTSPARPALVVCPTSLVTNWLREIHRFAPSSTAAAYRGGELDTTTASVVVTGYPTLRLHAPALTEREWSTVVFDEAQVLKNPRTQVTRAARAIPADARIALTGTPVENHLDELWALLNLVARNSFANHAQFRRRYTRPVRDGSVDAMRRLRAAIEPIVLARSKLDVARSLPPKLHTDIACDLTDEQALLYDRFLTAAVDDGFGEGIERRGRILATLTRLKQVCNHPELACPTGERELAGRSGKLDACTDILAVNLESTAPTIVFTQYRETGELLVAHFAATFGVEVPFLHGGLRRAQRDAVVDDYQRGAGAGLLIASVKAAGTGLTLTRAADVIHFDRWWNPAVEAQASDRVHRIGQTRPVTVTTLTTSGTVEEHIAELHRRKSALALDADPAGLAALTALSDERLVELLGRRRAESR